MLVLLGLGLLCVVGLSDLTFDNDEEYNLYKSDYDNYDYGYDMSDYDGYEDSLYEDDDMFDMDLDDMDDQQLLQALMDDEEWGRRVWNRVKRGVRRVGRGLRRVVRRIGGLKPACGLCQTGVKRLFGLAKSQGCRRALQAVRSVINRCPGIVRGLCRTGFSKACDFIVKRGTGMSPKSVCARFRLC